MLWFVRERQQKMAAVRQALQEMGAGMGVVVQHIYNIMDLCSDGQVRKLSEQQSRESAATSTDVSQPEERWSVAL